MSKTVLNNNLIKYKISQIRPASVSHDVFYNNVKQIGVLLASEAFKDIELSETEIISATNTKTTGYNLSNDIVVVPILRAGLGLLEGFRNVFPECKVGHIGVARNEETLEISEYYFKMPEVSLDSHIFIIDPMLATGNSVLYVINKIKKMGFKKITFVAMISTPEGIERLENEAADVNLIIGINDEYLNEKKYIIPGLGDAGDRIFGSKK